MPSHTKARKGACNFVTQQDRDNFIQCTHRVMMLMPSHSQHEILQEQFLKFKEEFQTKVAKKDTDYTEILDNKSKLKAFESYLYIQIELTKKNRESQSTDHMEKVRQDRLNALQQNILQTMSTWDEENEDCVETGAFNRFDLFCDRSQLNGCDLDTLPWPRGVGHDDVSSEFRGY